MKYNDFVHNLGIAGWKGVNDNGNNGIRNLWEKLFPHELETERLKQRLNALKDYQDSLKTNPDQVKRAFLEGDLVVLPPEEYAKVVDYINRR